MEFQIKFWGNVNLAKALYPLTMEGNMFHLNI
jgi:hypothetical protein